jgi:hypothetical protein
MDNEEKYKLIFRHGMAKNKTKENHILPAVVKKYEIYCSDLVNENANSDLEPLYILAAMGLRFLLSNPGMDIPKGSL